MNKVNLFADVLQTRGYLRSSLLDTTRFKVHFIDNETSDLFLLSDYKNVAKNKIEESFYEILNENELLFDSSNELSEKFPNLLFDWDSPYLISNFVFIFTNKNVDFLLKNNELTFVGNIHVVFNDFYDDKTFKKLIKFLNTQFCDCIEFSLIKKNDSFQKNIFEEKVIGLNKIVKILNYTDENFDKIFNEPHKYGVSVSKINLKISKFSDHYFESKLHHTYFNRKLFIDSNGEIKNAPECLETFGNINEINSVSELKQIISKSDFKKYWFVRKDDTDICKDCEFRHMCVDNRVPIQRKENEWFHELECTYNPYICKWNDEKGFKTLIECGVISNENGFSIDHEKIEQINAILWSEEEVETE